MSIDNLKGVKLNFDNLNKSIKGGNEETAI